MCREKLNDIFILRKSEQKVKGNVSWKCEEKSERHSERDRLSKRDRKIERSMNEKGHRGGER